MLYSYKKKYLQFGETHCSPAEIFLGTLFLETYLHRDVEEVALLLHNRWWNELMRRTGVAVLPLYFCRAPCQFHQLHATDCFTWYPLFLSFVFSTRVLWRNRARFVLFISQPFAQLPVHIRILLCFELMNSLWNYINIDISKKKKRNLSLRCFFLCVP